MRIAHSLVVTPGLCGLYETAKELILAEIALGHEAFVVEPEAASKGMTDSQLEVNGSTNSLSADVIVDHSGCDLPMLESGIPIIHIRHGRPLNTFMTELQGGLGVYSHIKRIAQDPRYVSIATMWKEHIPYWQALTGRDIDYIPAPVDLDKFTPNGPKHNFGGKGGEINVVCADRWNCTDQLPFETIHRWLETRNDNEILHIYGVQQTNPALTTFFDMLKGLGVVGEIGWCKDMASVYRAADYVITSANIATRAFREATACGCEIITSDGRSVAAPRLYAEMYHNPRDSADALLSIVERQLAAV